MLAYARINVNHIVIFSHLWYTSYSKDEISLLNFIERANYYETEICLFREHQLKTTDRIPKTLYGTPKLYQSEWLLGLCHY